MPPPIAKEGRNTANKRSGFTLMEMLIVVAIIAVLVAIAIPVFTSQVASARTASCQANQRSLQAAVSAAYMSNGLNRADAAASGVSSMGLDASNLTGSDPVFKIEAGSLCPEAGTYTITFNEGSIAVTCSKHFTSSLLGQDKTVMDTLGSALMGFNDYADSAGSFDGSAQVAAKLTAALKDEGIDLESLGAKSWAWRPDHSYPKFYWSSVDISDSSMQGQGVPLMSYNPDSQKYMVYTGTVGPRSQDGKNVYSTFKKESPQGESYEEAYERYQKLMKEQGYN